MKNLVLTAYQVLRSLAERKELAVYRNLKISYANVWPGKLIFSVKDANGKQKNCLIPVWQVKISEHNWKSAGEMEKKAEVLYLNLCGEIVVSPLEALFERIAPGAVFRYNDGHAYMLQECDNLHHKAFVPEPKYAIGLKKSPICMVCEG